MMKLEEKAARIVMAVHRSMNWEVWGSKRLRYWDILTNALRSSAYSNSLSRCLNSLCSRMQVEALGGNRAERAELEALLNGLSAEEERALLRLYREEATTLVLQVRVWIEEKRMKWETDESEWSPERERAEVKNGGGLNGLSV